MSEKLDAVQKMQDYIHSHLYEEISITDIARSSFFSPWYARRLFVQYLGITPADYTRKLRLRNAALQLRDEHNTILDVALDHGFSSVDGFQRAFHKEFGCNPKQYANHPVPLQFFNPYGVKYRKTKKEENRMSAKSVFITVMDKPARKVILKRGKTATEYWTYCQEVGCDVWGMLLSMKSISNEPICMWLPEKYILPGTSEYVQGVEVPMDYNDVIPDGFDAIELPAAKYLMFQGEPFEEEDFETAISDIWQAEKKYDPSIIGYQWDKDNPRIQLEPIGTRGYIELLPIK